MGRVKAKWTGDRRISRMTTEQAIKLLDPKTTGEAIAEIEYKAGFNGKAESIKAIEEACELACECMANYDRACKDVVRLSVENEELKAEIERLRKLA